MKNFLLILFLPILFVNAQESYFPPKYQKVNVFISTPQEFKFLTENGVGLSEFILKKGHHIETILSEQEVQKIESLGIQTEILVEDMQEFYQERALNPNKNTMNSTCESPYAVPENYHGGSMAGFLTHDEIMEELDEMRQLYPELISVKTQIGDFETVNGNHLYFVRVSDTPNSDSEDPEVLYTALHHAREPQSSHQLIFYLWYLLENYDSDSNIKNLVDHTEMYFVPIINPDGFKYNEMTNPNGFGMWRKNRNGSGVDINRNYGFEWGGEGSSGDPNSETYRGTAPFSEVETQAVKWFTEQHEFVAAINAHTFSGLYLYPFGYEENLPTVDQFVFENLGNYFVKENGYRSQLGSELYVTSGGSDDWMYGDTSTKPKIFSYTPELGTDFWPPQSEILPTNQGMIYANLTAARFAGAYFEFESRSNRFVEEIDTQLEFEVTKVGINGENNGTLTLVPISANIASVGAPENFSVGDVFEPINGQIGYTLVPGIQPGDPIIFDVKINNGVYDQFFRLTQIFGNKETLLDDPADDLENWTTTGNWGITINTYVSAPSSITDSPNGNYQNNAARTITLTDSFSLENVVDAYISFYTKWDIESLYDYVQFQISTDGGNTWIPQCGKLTVKGTQYQETGEPLYSGNNIQWKKEEIDLAEYIGQTNVKVRFVLVSDSYTTEDGFYFDDFQIHVLTDEMGTHDFAGSQFEIYPNPVKTELHISSDDRLVSYKIYDASGRLIQNKKFQSDSQTLNVSSLEKGNYILEIKTDKGISQKKFIKN